MSFILHIKTHILIYQITCASHISLTYQKLYYFSRYKSTIKSIIISNIIYISVLISKDPSSIISNPTYQITLQITCQLTYQATLVMSSDMLFDLRFDMYETKFISWYVTWNVIISWTMPWYVFWKMPWNVIISWIMPWYAICHVVWYVIKPWYVLCIDIFQLTCQVIYVLCFANNFLQILSFNMNHQCLLHNPCLITIATAHQRHTKIFVCIPVPILRRPVLSHHPTRPRPPPSSSADPCYRPSSLPIVLFTRPVLD